MTLGLAGCYDGGELVDSRQKEIDLVRMDEIEIGEFRVTLPRADGTPGGGVVEFSAFGQVSRHDRDEAAKALEFNRSELRDRVLLLVRSLSREDLAEPKLQKVRDGIAALANSTFDKQLVRNIGFYNFSFKPM